MLTSDSVSGLAYRT